MFVLTITYNFDGDYVAKQYKSYDEAKKGLLDFLNEEIGIVKRESKFTPSILVWDDDDVTLVYAEGYTKDEMNRSYATEDCAYYRIFEVK